jgi:hypothetical protein
MAHSTFELQDLRCATIVTQRRNVVGWQKDYVCQPIQMPHW